MNWNWKEEGFLTPPHEIELRQRLTVYRAWGGTASEGGSPHRPGVCYMLENPFRRSEAEGYASIFEWSNTATFLTKFEVAPFTLIWVGKVHPGDWYNHSLGMPGSQIFVEKHFNRTHIRKIGQAERLENDLKGRFVAPNRARLHS
ncbi:MAG: hypothetical protein AB2689_22665 [Candidatus Thiodiazotropha taylori]